MDIENLIGRSDRLKQGIFFTKHCIVNNIVNNFDFSNIKNVVDSAAGSCNFLIGLAKQYRDINFYGVEKNVEIYNEVNKLVSTIPNLHYYLGDIILDSFPIPKCDLYIGNPPFINFSDLDKEYREKIKPIWLNYFPHSKGFKMLLGDSRGDIAQLIFALTVDKYLVDRGEVGVILPNSLIKGNSASAGFREFSNLKVNKLVDISDDNPFDNTNRNCFYILGEKGSVTTFPIIYKTKARNIRLIKISDDLVEEGTSILKKSNYIARQGVNTLGANGIFIFKNEPPFESQLIKPLLKSSDIDPFHYKPSYKILFPYINGKPIDEETLQQKYPREYNYLLDFREKLTNRKSRFVNKCWYALFGIGEYTCKPYKVVWRGLGAKELLVSVTTDVIPNQAMNCYISTDVEDEAHYICGIMNSTLFKNQLKLLNEEGAKSFAQPNTINKIYIPKYNDKNSIHVKISSVSKQLSQVLKEEKLLKLEILVKELYIEEGFISSSTL